MLLLEWARCLKANINIPLQGVRDDHSLKEVKRPCYTSDVCIFLQSGWGQHLANDTEGFFSNGKHHDLPPSPLADAGFDKGPEEVKNAKKRIRGQLLGDAWLGSDPDPYDKRYRYRYYIYI